ncbi:MAG: hypothetical protein AAB676_10730 [Verrucomicrobiota bacterium]
MPDEFHYDVFLSHSVKDKAVVRPLAERLRKDGLNPKAEGRRQKADILHSSFNIPPSLCAFGSDWAQLLPHPQPSTLNPQPACAPLNKERRFMSELQPSAFILQPFHDAPIKGSLTQFHYINWRRKDRKPVYPKLLEACNHRRSRLQAGARCCDETVGIEARWPLRCEVRQTNGGPAVAKHFEPSRLERLSSIQFHFREMNNRPIDSGQQS